ncbi:MAG: hypothetical protein SFV21_18585 [Rhodospirillaceae bacterium]|nr:hypothetical protein [Rhodospirillaceae bacterium]
MTGGTRDLLLLVYTPREDSNQRGYEDWLRTIDNPFFNGVPGIRHYSNWKVMSPADCAFPYTHFDLMFLADAAAKDRVWSNPEVMTFAQGWTEKWGRYPRATPETMHMNYSVFLCSTVAGDQRMAGRNLTIMPAKGPIAAPPGDQVYEIAEPVLGDVRFTHFALRYLPDGRAVDAATRPAGCYAAAQASLIAAPNRDR